MVEFAALRSETFSYLTDDNDKNKKAKGTKKFVIERKLEPKDYKHWLEAI